MLVLFLRACVGHEVRGREATQMAVLTGIAVDPNTGVRQPPPADAAAELASPDPGAIPILHVWSPCVQPSARRGQRPLSGWFGLHACGGQVLGQTVSRGRDSGTRDIPKGMSQDVPLVPSRYPDVAATNPFTVNVPGHFGKTEMSRMSRTGGGVRIYRGKCRDIFMRVECPVCLIHCCRRLRLLCLTVARWQLFPHR